MKVEETETLKKSFDIAKATEKVVYLAIVGALVTIPKRVKVEENKTLQKFFDIARQLKKLCNWP